MATREVICADTAEWLKTVDSFDAVITSLPDMEETNMDETAWREWFVSMVAQIISKTKTYAIFYQTDRKKDGACIDKTFLVNKGAEQAGARQMWNKVFLRRDVGATDLFRPTFTHLMCFSKELTSGTAFPDVQEAGAMIYKNAMGLNACRVAVSFIKANSDAKTIVDPFCGRGSVLAVAEKMGFNSVGVEIRSDYAKLSRELRFVA
jgi:hypothetical protein